MKNGTTSKKKDFRTPYHDTLSTMVYGKTTSMKRDLFEDDTEGTGIVFPIGTSEGFKQKLRDIKKWLYPNL